MIVARANLYSGRAEEVKKRRPVFIAISAGVVLVIALILADVTRYRAVRALRETSGATGRLAAQLQRKLKSARAEDGEIAARVAQRDALLGYGARRRSWAPVLGTIFAAIPPGVELTVIEIAEEQPGNPRIRIAGKCMGSQPRLEADKCMLQLTHALAAGGAPMTGKFILLEDATSSLKSSVAETSVAEFVIQFTDGGAANEN